LLVWTAGAGALSSGAWVYTGTGSASSFLVRQSANITTTPGDVLTFSAYLDASHATTGGLAIWSVRNPALTTVYASVSQGNGQAGWLSTTFTVPVGVTSVCVMFDTENVTVASGQPLIFSDPQLMHAVSVVAVNNLQLLPPSNFDFASAAEDCLLAIIDAGGGFEIVAYQTALLTGVNTYQIANFRRGLYGTAIAAHASGAKVLKLDQGYSEFTYLASQVGSTNNWVKLTAFNSVGGRPQSVNTVSSTQFTLTGAFPGIFGIVGADGHLPSATVGTNLVYNGDFSIYTLPTGQKSAYASSVRANDTDFTGTPNRSCPNGWTRNFDAAGNGEGVIYQNSGLGFAPNGNFYLVMQDRQGSTNDLYAAVCDAFPVVAGKTYKMSGQFNIGLGTGLPAHATWYLRIYFYKAGTTDFSRSSPTLSTVAVTGTLAGAGFNSSSAGSLGIYDVVEASTLSGLQSPAAQVTAPSDAAYARIAIYHYFDGTAVATAWNLLAGDIRFVPVVASDEAIFTTSTPLKLQSSALPGQGLSLTTAAPTGTTLGVSWGAQTFTWPDGSTFTLSSGSQSFTGLTVSTSYSIYLYLSNAASGTATLNFLINAGPSLADVAATYQDGRLPLGFYTQSTTSGGTGTGGSVGDSCPHEDEPVYLWKDGAEIQVAAKDVRDGDMIKGYCFAEQKDIYRYVTHIRHSKSTMWYRVQGHLVSPCEQVFVDGQWNPAFKAPGAERVRGIAADRIEISVRADGHDEKNYYLAAETPLLIHNSVLPRS
jgi:hypothetical protein